MTRIFRAELLLERETNGSVRRLQPQLPEGSLCCAECDNGLICMYEHFRGSLI